MRIMTWNIEKFSYNTLCGDDNGLLSNVYRAVQGGKHIIENILSINPDIFIIIEVSSGVSDGPGSLIPKRNAPGVLVLLNRLRSEQASANWCLVPPLISYGPQAHREGVGVFFKNAVVDFAGPFRLGPSTNEETVSGYNLSGRDTPPPYPDPWMTSATLPNTIPVGPSICLENTTTPLTQNQLAARNRWDTFFIDTVEGRNFRAPYQTVFREKKSDGTPTGRSFNIFSVHAPPNNTAELFVSEMAKLRAVSDNNATNEVKIITGDFNINYLDPNEKSWYRPLCNLGYHITIKDEPTNLATETKATVQGVSPYYGYMSQGHFSDTTPLPRTDVPRKVLDDFFVRPSPSLTYRGFVVNRVIDFNGPGISLPSALTRPIQHILDDPTLKTDDAKNEAFQNIINYGKLRVASDHLAIFIDI